MTELTGLVEHLAREFAGSGATGGTLCLHRSRFSGGQSSRDVVGTHSVGQQTCTRELADAVRSELGVSADAAILMRVRLDGLDYEFQYRRRGLGDDAEWDFARQLVLDPDYCYPGHQRPVPATNAVLDTRPTNPDVLATVRELVRQYADAYSKANSRAPGLGPGTCEEDIAAAETRIGYRLPEDLRALYRVVGYDHDDRGVLGITRLMSLDQIAANHLNDHDYADMPSPGRSAVGVWDDSLFGPDRVVFDGWPHGVIRRVSRSAGWVTVGTSDGAVHAVDLDPGPAGRRGQLIEYEPSGVYPPTRWAESVIEALHESIAAQRVGQYPHPDTTPAYSRKLRGGDQSIGDLPGQFAIQELELCERDSFDATELAALHMVRKLRFSGIGSMSLAVPPEIPLESLDAAAPCLDLDPLRGHPMLWDVRLAGAEHPVRLAALATLKNLQRLDISQIDVADLEVVATLSNLRVLVANLRQWRHLFDNNAVPANLAAAELAGDVSFADESHWAAHFGRGADIAALPVIRGTLTEIRPTTPRNFRTQMTENFQELHPGIRAVAELTRPKSSDQGGIDHTGELG